MNVDLQQQLQQQQGFWLQQQDQGGIGRQAIPPLILHGGSNHLLRGNTASVVTNVQVSRRLVCMSKVML